MSNEITTTAVLVATIDNSIAGMREQRREIANKGASITGDDRDTFLSLGRMINHQQLQRDNLLAAA